jgi:hypothetical protein
MTQEERDILLKDICARLPYGIKVNNEIQGDFNIYGICENFVFGRNEVCHIDFDIEKIKPYLFPLSSMTEEQSKTYHELVGGMFGTGVLINLDCLIDFFNRNHLDWRGLIPLGLAEDATNLNIY